MSLNHRRPSRTKIVVDSESVTDELMDTEVMDDAKITDIEVDA